jgi:hypothetical protein
MVGVVVDPRLAQDMHRPLPNSELKHLVGQYGRRLRPSATRTRIFPLGAVSTAIVHLSVFSRVPGLIIPPTTVSRRKHSTLRIEDGKDSGGCLKGVTSVV